MKKLILVGAASVFAFAFAVAAFHRFGPTLGKRAMQKCQEMFEGHSEERAFEEERRQLASSVGR